MITNKLEVIDLCISNNRKAIEELENNLKTLNELRLIELQKMTLNELWDYTAQMIKDKWKEVNNG